MKSNTLAIALASLLVGGVAVAAFQNNRDKGRDDFVRNDAALGAGQAYGDVPASSIPDSGRLEYAQVVDVRPITEKHAQYAQVIGTEPVRESTTTSSPREVCNDVVVQDRLPERDGNVGGTVAGAVIGGLVGNQLGKRHGGNDRRNIETVAGAVGGAFAGRAIDQRHVGGRVVNRTERQCHTVSESSQSSQVVAYNVTYRNPDGTTGTMRTGSKPGSRIPLGNESQTVGYDVTYRYDGQERTVRMDERPGERLPVVDGQVVTQVASSDGSGSRG